ncbi:MAG: sensor signal transduction histidine kinase [Dehalococcoidia bacterium]|nr:sensor signal transduction histidine kinase [Dehalococcoidia bacterium]
MGWRLFSMGASWANVRARARRGAQGASLRQEMQLLYRQLQDATDMPGIARALASTAAQGVGACRVLLFLRGLPQGDFGLVAEEGGDGPAPPALRVSHPFLAWLESQSRVVAGGEIWPLPQWQGLSPTEREALSALEGELFVPMRVRGVLIALLVLGRRTGGAPYAREEMEWLELVAHQAAASMEVTSLYDQLDQERQKLDQAREQMARSTRMAAIGDAAVTLAREINNPLQSILNVTHLMGHDVDEGGVSREDIDVVKAEAMRACGALRALLDMAAGDEPAWGVHDLNSLLSSVVSDSGLNASTSSVVPVLRLDPAASRVWCEGEQLRRVLLNLIANALDAMPQGGRLTISTQGVAGKVEVKLTDTGIGIPPENLERVFDPFFTTRPDGEGTGLGLAASRRSVERHRGTIGVESQVGKGTTVTILLPLRSAEQGVDP